MVSRSYSNLLELAAGGSGGEPLPSLGRRRIPRVVTASGIVPDLDVSDAASAADQSSHAPRERVIIVANQLPVRASRRAAAGAGGGGWDFAWDQDSLLLQVKDSLRAHHGRADVEFVYVGGLRDDVPPAEHDQVAHDLLEGFRCVPTFLPADLRSRFYHGFCKQQLWPLFHYMLPLSPELGGRFDRLLWQAYVSVNKIFADKILEVQEESDAMVRRINDAFGQPGYQPVILIDQPLQFYERMAYYVVAECCLVTAVRDGMNLIPYEYVIARQGNERIDSILGLGPASRKKSMLVVSEFIGCSPSLSGAIRVNPWNIDSVADAMDYALEMPEGEKVLRHEKHHRYVSTHDVGYWANSFLQDLERICLDHNRRRCWGIGFGLKFRVVALDPNFKKLAVEHLVLAYRRTKKRVILLDYDGTLMPQTSLGKSPTSRTIDMLNSLCRDRNNMVFLVSAKSRMTLNEWFLPCESLGLAAEHGCFLRLRRDAEWETCVPVIDCSWKQIAEPVMKTYTETTDGSTIEDKETAIVWCYEDADPDFGSCQAKELHDHLESVLANEPVSVKAGPNLVEVKPQGVSKGLVAKRILSTTQERGDADDDLPDFVLCVGDDRSDEDMFEVIAAAAAARGVSSLQAEAEVFACTVGRKPSKAKYYLDDPADIVRLVQGLASVSDDDQTHAPPPPPPSAATTAADTVPR
ncbi:trehalose-6-phosphate synthase13 [Zea mays]|uniref:Trehalose-6-phosphate synthase13 n=1 Tax=Zea mays TaxID=4577 RepID=A0A1D6I3Y4_MAIZE|nr:trehalose-6-phosphate synthase13 [Zea mays]